MDNKVILALLAVAAGGLAVVVLGQGGHAVSATTETEKITAVVRTNSSHSAGPFAYDGYGEASCKKGETLTGGGYYSGFHDALSVYENRPSDDGTKWLVTARYTPGGPTGGTTLGPAPEFEVYAVCMKLVP